METDNQVIVKMNTLRSVHQSELKTMLAIKQHNLQGFSLLLDHGSAEEENTFIDNAVEISKVFFIVMEQLGMNLSLIQTKYFPTGFSLKTVAQIGLNVLNSLESLH